eukprot:775099-Amorphochlora_amoeboformis.AAC.1
MSMTICAVVPLDFQNGWIRHPRGWSLVTANPKLTKRVPRLNISNPNFVHISSRKLRLPFSSTSVTSSYPIALSPGAKSVSDLNPPSGLLAMSASSIRSAGVNAQGAHSQTSGATGEMKSKSSRGGGISGLQTVFPDAAKSSISAIQKPNQVSNSSYATDKGLSALVSRLIDDIRTAGKRKGSFGIGGGETLCEGKKAAGDKPAWARAEVPECGVCTWTAYYVTVS